MFDFLLDSRGILRTLGAGMIAVGQGLSVVPESKFQLVGSLLINVGGWVAGVGFVRAGVAKALKK